MTGTREGDRRKIKEMVTVVKGKERKKGKVIIMFIKTKKHTNKGNTKIEKEKR